MNETGQLVYTIAVVIPWIILIVAALQRWIRHDDPVPGLFMIGGLCCIVVEPVVDVMGMCFFPIHGQWVGIETFKGRPVPIWMFPIYSWFVGGQAYLLWRSMHAGRVSGATIWKHWLIAWGVNIVLETPGLLVGVYTYYGPHAFNFWGLPLWWPAVNSTMPIVAAFIVHHSWRHLNGWRVITIVPLTVMADGLVNGGLAWPTWSALNSGYGLGVTYPAAILTMILAAIAIWVLAKAMPAVAGTTQHAAAAGNQCAVEQRPSAV